MELPKNSIFAIYSQHVYMTRNLLATWARDLYPVAAYTSLVPESIAIIDCRPVVLKLLHTF